MTRLVSFLAVVAVAIAGCGGRAEIYADEDAALQERGVTLPEAIPATPAFIAHLDRPLAPEDMATLEEIPGAAAVAPLTIQRAAVKGPAGKVRLRVAQMEPLRFRPVAPPSTRDADFVWISLVLGKVVPTIAAAERLGLDGGGELSIDGDRGFPVGAFADNGVPNIADIMVQGGGDRDLDLGRPNTVVIGAETGVTIQRLARDVRRHLPRARVQRLLQQNTAPPPPTSAGAPLPQQVGRVEGGVIGSMRFQILPNGFIRPDPAWVAANIVSAEVPILGRVTCHRLMIPRLSGALTEIEREGLARLIRPAEYGGCFVPRFIDRDPSRPLSNHAFGLAVDINVRTNQLNTRGDMDPRLVAIFSRWGFNWGGVWNRPDPMHFELTR